MPRQPKALHDLMWAGWIDAEGKFKFNGQGVPCVAFGKHKDVPMRRVPRDYYTWMLKPAQHFGRSTRRIADDAYRGTFPIAPSMMPTTEQDDM